VDKTVVNVFHLADQIEKYFKTEGAQISDERHRLLGSGGGVHKASNLLSTTESFFYANADEIILPTNKNCIERLIEKHETNQAIATLLVTKHPEVGEKFGGAWSKDHKTVLMFSKENPGKGFYGFHFVGIILINNRIKKYFKPQITDENILYETLTKAINNGEKVILHEEPMDWFETGNPKDFQNSESQIHFHLQKNDRPWVNEIKSFIRSKGSQEVIVTDNRKKSEDRIKDLLS
jgi:NDP-sugar pyrophosphorylase family protein